MRIKREGRLAAVLLALVLWLSWCVPAASARTGTASVQTGTASVQTGTASVQTGTASARTNLTADLAAVERYDLSGSGLSITYDVEPGDTVQLDREDFQDFYERRGGEGSLRYVTFSWDSSASAGKLYYDYNGDDERSLSRTALKSYTFYYRDSKYGDFPLNRLTFAASGAAGGEEAEFSFTVHGDEGEWNGTLTIEVKGGSSDRYGEISYQIKPGATADIQRSDFNTLYRRYFSASPQYVAFTSGTVADISFFCDSHTFTGSTLGNYKFYYSSSDYGDYPLDGLSFTASSQFSGSRTLRFTIRGASGDVSGAVIIRASSTSASSSSSSTTISYSLAAGEEVSFRLDDFLNMAESRLNSSLRYVTFTTSDNLTSSAGLLYRNYGKSGERAFTRDTLPDFKFYAYSADYGDYPISELSFAAPEKAVARTFRLRYTLHDSRGETATGNVEITLSAYRASSGSTDVTVTTNPQTGVTTVTTSDGRTATVAPETSNSTGTSSSTSGSSTSTSTNTTSQPADPEDSPKFADDSLYMDSASETAALLETAGADIRCIVSNSAPVRVGEGDLQRFFLQSYPNGTLERVRLLGVPAVGRLYYNYYGSSKYGSAFPKLMAASDLGKQDFYLNPSTTDRYSLGELYYIPVSGANVCAVIPFAAYGKDAGQSARGTILISATRSAVGEVYGVTARDTAVSFPTEPIRAAVSAATNLTPASIEILSLPPAAAGKLYEGEGGGASAVTAGKAYAFPSATDAIRFVPASGFTGTVSVPYAALDGTGTAFAAGTFSVGVVSTLRQFPDVSMSSWCVKYVTELADAGILGGYPDGTFQPDRPVTYGAALKLILLSAGYPEQEETVSNTSDVFARYLTFARAQGIVSGDVNLSTPITRLQVARIAAAAMKLSSTTTSQPFTDTEDPSVLALHALGILNGYDENGVSTFRPNNTLTRGQLAAIVWRIRNYR